MKDQPKLNVQSIADKFSNTIKKAQQEVEQMAIQFSLGKAEAAEQFEKTKKEFNEKLQEWKKLYPELEKSGMAGAEKLKAKMEELQVQLALGKAEAKDLFEEQKKKIMNAVAEVESEIKSNPSWVEYRDDFKGEVEKFKLKMEILKMQFSLKKMEVSDKFKDAIKNAQVESDKLFVNATKKWDATKSKYTGFSDEIEAAFDHLKKAVKSL